MIHSIFFLFTVLSIFAQSASTAALAGVTPYTAVYPIDPSQRGADIISMVNTLSSFPYFVFGASDVVIQTTLSQNFTSSSNGTQGLIPFVQTFNPSFAAPHNTLLIVTYSTSPTTNLLTNQYAVVPVEQISEVIYSNTTIPNTSVFTSTISSGVLPYYQVNMMQRAADIQSVVYTLNNNPIFNNRGIQKVSMQTTLRGPFYTPSGGSTVIVNGTISLVQDVTLTGSRNGTLMIVRYLVNNLNTYIVVSPEQVTGITYSRS